jgi:hypothetical protein
MADKPFEQYTSCVEPINFTSMNVVGYTYVLGILGAIVAAFASSFNVYTLPILIGLLIALIIFLIWWLYGRLICLKHDQCVIGIVKGHNHPPDYTKAGDDDYTVNIFLAGGPLDINEPKENFWTAPLGDFVKEQQAILQIGQKYAKDGSDLAHVKMLHCEFEGSGIRNLLAWASTALALLVAALILLLTAGAVGAILSVILWILAALAGVGAIINYIDPIHVGDPNDIDPTIGELNPGDLIFIKGDWIYDSLHVGWNEIHPVKDCRVILRKDDVDLSNGWPADIGMGLGLDTPDKIKTAADFFCNSATEVILALEGGSREDPAQNWVIHPAIDGCAKLV